MGSMTPTAPLDPADLDFVPGPVVTLFPAPSVEHDPVAAAVRGALTEELGEKYASAMFEVGELRATVTALRAELARLTALRAREAAARFQAADGPDEPRPGWWQRLTWWI